MILSTVDLVILEMSREMKTSAEEEARPRSALDWRSYPPGQGGGDGGYLQFSTERKEPKGHWEWLKSKNNKKRGAKLNVAEETQAGRDLLCFFRDDWVAAERNVAAWKSTLYGPSISAAQCMKYFLERKFNIRWSPHDERYIPGSYNASDTSGDSST